MPSLCGRPRDDGHRGTFDRNVVRRVERDLARQSPTDSYGRSEGRRKVRCACPGLVWWQSVRGPPPRVDAGRSRDPRARQGSALRVLGRISCRDRPSAPRPRQRSSPRVKSKSSRARASANVNRSSLPCAFARIARATSVPTFPSCSASDLRRPSVTDVRTTSISCSSKASLHRSRSGPSSWGRSFTRARFGAVSPRGRRGSRILRAMLVGSLRPRDPRS